MRRGLNDKMDVLQENARRHYTHSKAESEEKMNSCGNIDEMSFKHIMKFIIEQEKRRREQSAERHLTYMMLFEAEPLPSRSNTSHSGSRGSRGSRPSVGLLAPP